MTGAGPGPGRRPSSRRVMIGEPAWGSVRPFLLLQAFQGDPEQGRDRRAGEPLGRPGRVAGGRIRADFAELRPLAPEQPDRLDRGQLDDPQDDLGGDRHPILIIIPGPDRDPEGPGQVGTASLAVEFGAERPQPVGEAMLDPDRFGGVLATRHGTSSRRRCRIDHRSSIESGRGEMSRRRTSRSSQAARHVQAIFSME